MRIIEGRAMHLSHFSHMNDATEGMECDRVITELYPEDWQQRAIGNFTSGLCWYRRDVPVFVLSLSKEKDLLSQWRSYGSVALGFNLLEKAESHSYRLQCLYDFDSKVRVLNDLGLDKYYESNSKDPFQIEALNYAGLVINLAEDEFDSLKERELARLEKERLSVILGADRADYLQQNAWNYLEVVGGGGYRDAFGMAAHLNNVAYPIHSFKHEGFVEEKEVRLVIERPNKICFKPSAIGPYPKPYVSVDVGFQEEDGKLLHLQELRIGPAVDSTIAVKSWSEFLQHSGSSALVSASEIPYVG